MTELLPCPFCGESDAFIERIHLSSCAVICNQCQARGPECCPEDEDDLEQEEANDWEPGEAAARREWNKRPSLAAHDAVLLRDCAHRLEHAAPYTTSYTWDVLREIADAIERGEGKAIPESAG